MEEIKHGRLWELTSYEWRRKSGLARFGYTHRFTGEHRDVYREQKSYHMPALSGDSNHMEDK